MACPASRRERQDSAPVLVLKRHELAALRFLAAGPHRMTGIDCEAALGAFLTLVDLASRGLVDCTQYPPPAGGAEVSLTVEGIDAPVDSDGAR